MGKIGQEGIYESLLVREKVVEVQLDTGRGILHPQIKDTFWLFMLCNMMFINL